MFGRILMGWVLTTVCYFAAFWASASLFRFFFREPIDLGRPASGVFIGAFLLTVPYIVAGIYARKVFPRPAVGALWVSIVPVVAERGLIYLIGALVVAAGGDGSMDGITTMMFIQGEAAPYYTGTYILLGVISVLLALFIALVPVPGARDTMRGSA